MRDEESQPARLRPLGRRPRARSAPTPQSANHGGSGQNALFEDGHVEFLRTSRPAGRVDDIFANDDNLVAAGVTQRFGDCLQRRGADHLCQSALTLPRRSRRLECFVQPVFSGGKVADQFELPLV